MLPPPAVRVPRAVGGRARRTLRASFKGAGPSKCDADDSAGRRPVVRVPLPPCTCTGTRECTYSVHSRVLPGDISLCILYISSYKLDSGRRASACRGRGLEDYSIY